MSDVDAYYKKQPSPQKEICLKLRETIFNHFPDIREEMKWGVPVFASGKVYIVALKNHVNLGFSLNELSAQQKELLKGSGKTMKHLPFQNLSDIDEKILVDLLNAVLKT